jgi:hypothetical protein
MLRSSTAHSHPPHCPRPERESPKLGPRTSTALCCLLIVCSVGVFHSRVLFEREVTIPWDFTGYHYPLLVAYADALHAGELPLWDPLTYCGRPLLANPQVAGFYPPIAIAAAWGRDGLLSRLEWLAIAHTALAGVFTFFLARRLGSSTNAALVAALAFCLGPFYASQLQHIGLVMSSPWIVLSWYAVLFNSRVRILCFSLAWTGCLLAGFTAFLLVTCVSTFLLGILVAPRRRILLDLTLGSSVLHWNSSRKASPSTGPSGWVSAAGSLRNLSSPPLSPITSIPSSRINSAVEPISPRCISPSDGR